MIYLKSTVEKLVKALEVERDFYKAELVSAKDRLKELQAMLDKSVDRLLVRENVAPIGKPETRANNEKTDPYVDAFERMSIIGGEVGDEPPLEKVKIIGE